ncbi:MAG: hypothetical protein NVS9B14_20870 [Candidatus Acidiferrum sp.]
MKLIFHIFKKDLRHHWPAALVCIALLTLYTWDQPRHWGNNLPEVRFLPTLLRYLPLFLALSWIFLLVRTVQDESLVGNRQFWITRPYRWPALLAAKLLMALFFVHFPHFLAQVILLKLAFFPVAPAFYGLLQIQLMLFYLITLPAFVIGAVTRSIGQAVLAALGLALCLLGFAYIAFQFPNVAFAGDTFDGLQATVLLVAAVSIIVVQFAYRLTRASWYVLAGFFAVVAFLIFLGGTPRIIERNMPLPTAAHPLPARFKFDPTVSFQHEEGSKLETFRTETRLELPFLVEDLPDNTLVQIAGVKLDLDLPTGEHWTSSWHSSYEEIIPGRTRVWPSVDIDRSMVDQLNSSSINARLSLALNVYRTGASSSVFLRGDSLRLPEDTRCTQDRFSSRLRCFSALKSPRALLVYADLPNAECHPATDGLAEPWAAAPAFFANLSESTSPDFDFTPVHETLVSLSRRHIYEDLGASIPLCSGTSLVLAHTKFQYTVRTEIGLGNIRLGNYAPTYPRRILPRIPRTLPHNSTGTLSSNFPPPMIRDR